MVRDWLAGWWKTFRYRAEHRQLRRLGPFDPADFEEVFRPGGGADE